MEDSSRDRPELRLTSRQLPGPRLLASALDAVPGGVCVLDREQVVRYRNFRFAETWGIPESEARTVDGRKLAGLADALGSDLPELSALCERVAGEPERVHAERVPLEDGRTVEVEIRPRYGPEGLDGWVGLCRDVGADDEAARSRERLLERLRERFEENAAGSFLATERGEVVRCNEAFSEILGFDDPAAAEGADLARGFLDDDDWRRLAGDLAERGSVRGVELPLTRRDGSPAWLRLNAALTEGLRDGRAVIEGTAVDVTAGRELQDRLDRLAAHDPETGLSNRRALAERVRRARATADRHGSSFAIARVELLDRARWAERLGPDAGGRVLVEVGRRLEAVLREADAAARVADDAFGVLLPEIRGPADALTATERLLSAFDEPVAVEGRDVTLDVRAGVALYPKHGSTLEELLSRAAEAGAGPGVRTGGAAVHGGERDEHPAVTPERLERALAEDEIVLHYQPVYDLSDRRLVGAEALVRWEHPDHGILPAAVFVPVAERSGLIRRLDRLVIESALRQDGAWIGEPTPDWIAIRLSRATALDPETGTRLRTAASEHGRPLERLLLELRHRDVEREGRRGLEAVRRLRDAGCRVGLRGYRIDARTLARLRHPSEALREVDVLLLEGEASADPSLFRDIVRHGHELGLEIAAVGVEREDRVTWIGSSGADLVQGYALGRPVPPEDLSRGGG